MERRLFFIVFNSVYNLPLPRLDGAKLDCRIDKVIGIPSTLTGTDLARPDKSKGDPFMSNISYHNWQTWVDTHARALTCIEILLTFVSPF